MVMIEALATGTPVVATPSGAAPEIVTDMVSGYLAADEAGLVEALNKIDDIDRQLCRQVVEERFSAERMVAAHLRVYQQVAEAAEQRLFGGKGRRGELGRTG
jgi:glycosyltransferase involved in cell wall biosynthesis